MPSVTAEPVDPRASHARGAAVPVRPSILTFRNAGPRLSVLPGMRVLVLVLMVLAAGSLVLLGRLTHTVELRGHLEGSRSVEASLTLHAACGRSIYYVVVGGQGFTARHADLTACR